MAGKSKTNIRLFVEPDLSAGASVSLAAEQAHYLRNVLRRGVGDGLLLFNGRDGEWRGEITALERNAATVSLAEQTRGQITEPDIWLLFAPVKKARLDMIIEKATELGVARLQPVITRYTDVERVKTERLQAQVREAAEQCERLTLPAVAEPITLQNLLAGWSTDRPLIMADEEGGAPALAELQKRNPSAAAILIGPEGGFAPEERDALAAREDVIRVSLGPRILRAETAVLAMLTLWQAACGDWRG